MKKRGITICTCTRHQFGSLEDYYRSIPTSFAWKGGKTWHDGRTLHADYLEGWWTVIIIDAFILAMLGFQFFLFFTWPLTVFGGAVLAVATVVLLMHAGIGVTIIRDRRYLRRAGIPLKKNFFFRKRWMDNFFKASFGWLLLCSIIEAVIWLACDILPLRA